MRARAATARRGVAARVRRLPRPPCAARDQRSAVGVKDRRRVRSPRVAGALCCVDIDVGLCCKTGRAGPELGISPLHGVTERRHGPGERAWWNPL